MTLNPGPGEPCPLGPCPAGLGCPEGTCLREYIQGLPKVEDTRPAALVALVEALAEDDSGDEDEEAYR